MGHEGGRLSEKRQMKKQVKKDLKLNKANSHKMNPIPVFKKATAELNYKSAPASIKSDGSQIQTSYADSNQLMAVEFDSKIIIYWWMTANFILMSVVGIILMPI